MYEESKEIYMNRTFKYALISGIILFVLILWYFSRKSYEHFEDNSSTDATQGTEESQVETSSNDKLNINEIMSKITDTSKIEYTEDFENIPNKDALSLYLTTFSDYTLYDENEKVYNPQTQRWNNFVTKDQPFFIISSDTLPYSIKAPAGLSIKNKSLSGIRSDALSVQDDFMLKSFSVSFFLKMNSIVFDGVDKMELLDIYVETPNYVRVYLGTIPDDTTKINIVIHLGGPTNVYSIPVAKDTLLTTGSPILLSIIYNNEVKDETKLLCYLGETQHEVNIVPSPTIFLGNSRIRINKSGKIDAEMYAFMYYNNILKIEDHKRLKSYLDNQLSGINSIIDKLKKVTDEELNKLTEELNKKTKYADKLRKELTEKCGPVDEIEPTKPKYSIDMMGKSDITAEDLKSCSVLNIKKPSKTVEKKDAEKTEDKTEEKKETPKYNVAASFLDDVEPKEIDFRSHKHNNKK